MPAYPGGPRHFQSSLTVETRLERLASQSRRGAFDSEPTKPKMVCSLLDAGTKGAAGYRLSALGQNGGSPVLFSVPADGRQPIADSIFLPGA
jgi:hypothetical protein